MKGMMLHEKNEKNDVILGDKSRPIH